MIYLALFLRGATSGGDRMIAAAERVALTAGPDVELATFDMESDSSVVRRLLVRHAPCLAVLTDEGDTGIRMYGSIEGPGELALRDVVRVAAGCEPGLPAPARERLRELAEPEHLRLFTPHGHPLAADLVRAVASVAIASPLVCADIFNATEFLALGSALGVRSLPAVLAGPTELALPGDGSALAHALLKARCWDPGSGSAIFRTTR